LIEENYQAIIRRLQSSGMSPGVNILFHGAPGTGKTESVLQIAKATGREIMKVEISQTKSMWFGESEKIIKRIFKNYEILQKQLKSTPILFFNEADAILGKRKSVDSGNTAQTENAIQNILLEELENFKGIFMATTNLTNNLDKAFDRRFLFKVEFKNPSIEAAANIWKSKLPFLKKKDALFLAENFPFSGGQIDNIAKKSEIEFVLNNKRPSLSEISTYCHSEDLSKKENTFGKIGF
jgi:SpoVK/Ycf46/Vps4 family AAA+-type ATPase